MNLWGISQSPLAGYDIGIPVQEPITVSMILVDPTPPAVEQSEDVVTDDVDSDHEQIYHGMAGIIGATSSNSSSGGGGGIGLAPVNTQNPPPAPAAAAVVVNAPVESDTFSSRASSLSLSSSESEAEETAGHGSRGMSSVEQGIRGRAINALNNQSSLLLHALSMNEVNLFTLC